MENAPILSLHDVTRRYGALEAVSCAAFQLTPGRITCLLGPSGCGKSTVLRMIAGLEPVDAGEIVLRVETVSAPRLTVPPEKRGVGLVFQDNALFPHLDVRGNVGFGLSGMTSKERQARVEALLARFHVAHLASAWPHTLSGGEQQRVAIARALALEPALLLLDEPFSGLDSHLRATVRRSLLADLRAVGTTVLIVTHDPDEALGIADDLVLMAGGRVLQAGDPAQCYDNPVSAVAASLLGEAIIFPAQVRQGVASTPLGPVPAAGRANGPAELMVRPAGLALAEEGARALLHSARRLREEWLLDLSVDDVAFTLRTRRRPPASGEEVCLSVDCARARVYPPA